MQPRNAGGTNFFGLLLLILVIVAALSFLVRIQTGLLGLVLGASAVGLAVYWFRALKNSIKTSTWDDYLLELHQDGDYLDVTAQVPGPENKVKVELFGKKLVLQGGMGFRRTVKLPFEAILRDLRYANGILNAKLVKKPTQLTAR
ncbi:MAG: hypothetical protein QXF45_05150 [Candidatus Caldarchaeum sp.]